MNAFVALIMIMQIICISGQPTAVPSTADLDTTIGDLVGDDSATELTSLAASPVADAGGIAEEQIIRDITGESDIPDANEGMDLAESGMVFRPLFAYRKQVLRRQRLRAQRKAAILHSVLHKI